MNIPTHLQSFALADSIIQESVTQEVLGKKWLSLKKSAQKGKLARFLSYYKPHLPLFLVDMACATLIAGVDILFPMASRHAMYQLLPDRDYSSFFWLMGILVLAYIVRSAMQYVVTYFGHVLGVRMEADMRRDLFPICRPFPSAFMTNRAPAS